MTTSARPPRPNAPNSPAWTRPLEAPPPPRPAPKPGTRAARIAAWSSPLPPVTVQTRRAP